MSKPKLVIFEGCDKSGKTTLYQKYRRATLWKPLCLDRFILSNLAYDIFYARKRDENYCVCNLINTLVDMTQLFKIYIVLCTVDSSIAERRIDAEEKGDLAMYERVINNHEKTQEIFKSLIPLVRDKGITIGIVDTNNPIESCIEDLLEFTGEEKKEWKKEAAE